jgi:hypothetical protein
MCVGNSGLRPLTPEVKRSPVRLWKLGKPAWLTHVFTGMFCTFSLACGYSEDGRSFNDAAINFHRPVIAVSLSDPRLRGRPSRSRDFDPPDEISDGRLTVFGPFAGYTPF